MEAAIRLDKAVLKTSKKSRRTVHVVDARTVAKSSHGRGARAVRSASAISKARFVHLRAALSLTYAKKWL